MDDYRSPLRLPIEDRWDKNKTAENNVIKVIIADDHPLVRKAIKSVIEQLPDMKVIAEACNGIEAIESAARLSPDVIIMDIGMPKINGLEATRQIKTQCPKTAILILTVYEDNEHIIGLLKSGAAGYLVKDIFGEELVHAIYNVVSGETVLSNQVAQQLIKYVVNNPPQISAPIASNLSIREVDILKLAAQGKSNKEIGKILQLSPLSVKGSLSSIFSKMNVGSRTEAVIQGLRCGFLLLSDLESQ